MQKISLSSKTAWQFRQVGQTTGNNGVKGWLPASVPGGAHTDLLALELIPDPFIGDNEISVMWVAESDWEYRRDFELDAKTLSMDKVFLVCDGLDTLAEVFINGTSLGKTDNMFRQYRWDIKERLSSGKNEILIRFRLSRAVLPGRAGEERASRRQPGDCRRTAPA